MSFYSRFQISATLPVSVSSILYPFGNFLILKCGDLAPLNNPEDLNLITDKYFKLRKNYSPPKYPIVLCHGLSGFDTLVLLKMPQLKPNAKKRDLGIDENLGKVSFEVARSVQNSNLMFNYWYGIEDALRKAGVEVITAKVAPFDSISHRAQLLDMLLSETSKNYPGMKLGERVKVNLIGHSMGGLDARYLISKIQSAKSPYEVVSLTTIGTPHRGSEVADFVMRMVSRDKLLSAVCPVAISQLTTEYLAQFNLEVKNDPNVGYFSFGALMNPSGLKFFRPTYEIIRGSIERTGSAFVENDGMVSVSLARWGNYEGTLDNVDHLDLINWTISLPFPKVELQKFNPIALYLDIADTLSRNGY